MREKLKLPAADPCLKQSKAKWYFDSPSKAVCLEAGERYITHMCAKLFTFNDQIRMPYMNGVDFSDSCTCAEGFQTPPHSVRREQDLAQEMLYVLYPSPRVLLEEPSGGGPFS